MNYDWLRESEIRHLEGDMRLIAEHCGKDVLITLLGLFEKSEVYFSAGQLERALSVHLKKYPRAEAKRAARELGIDIRKVKKLMEGGEIKPS